jgi:hypothetical protein
MAYTKQTWADSDPSRPVSAARMTVIENGIEATATVADGAATQASTALTTASNAVNAVNASIPPYVTTLPGSPTDGQEIYYGASPTNGVIWHLRYRSGATGSFKWEFIGGPSLASDLGYPATGEQYTSSGTPGDLSTVGPSLTVPLAGQYDIRWGSRITPTSGASAGTVGVVLGGATTATIDLQCSFTGDAHYGASVSAMSVQTLTAGIVAKLIYSSSAGQSVGFYNRSLRILPICVG